MILRRTIGSRHFRDLLKLQKSSIISLSSPKSDELLFLPPLPCRTFSLWTQFTKKIGETIQKRGEPLIDFFRREISAPERADNGGAAAESSETTKVSEKVRVLEGVVRGLKKERVENGKSPRLLPAERIDSNERSGAKVNLSALFSDTKTKKKVKSLKATDFGNEDPAVYKGLSSDMRMFTYHLYTEGYLKDANFVTSSGKFDVTCLEISHARDSLKSAAKTFGQDHQEIAKWLSARDLKKVALFGCPTIGRNSVYAAKGMRKFFDIEEQKVCGECTLKESCKHANKRLKKFPQLQLGKVTRLLIVYAMESYPQELVVPEEIKDCVGRLLKQIVKLSQTTS